MKAQSISINLQGGCDAVCPFCISRLTHKTGVRGNERLLRNLDRALRFAAFHGVDTALITGSGEPTLEYQTVREALHAALNAGIPKVELQTNGLRLYHDSAMLRTLADNGLSTVAVSMAHPRSDRSCEIMWPGGERILRHHELFRSIEDLGMIGRISLNLTALCFRDIGFGNWNNRPEDEAPPTLDDWVDAVRSWGVRQVGFRELGVPSNDEGKGQHANEVREWVGGHGMKADHLQMLRNRIEQPDRILRRLDFGPSVYDYRGLSAVVLTCMTDNQDPDEIRSLILQPDGHVYHSWNFTGSILL